MKRVAMHGIAVLLGMGLGWVAMAQPIAAIFAPTPVSWEASTCAAGVYSVTSTARSLDGRATYRVTSDNVTLPRPLVVQEFPDLPAGQYSVTARATRADGHALESSSQIVTSLGGASIGGGRRRPAGVEPVGTAQPRTPGASSAPAAPPSATSGAARARAVPDVAPEVAPSVKPAGPLGPGADWRRIKILDLDLDGRADEIRIELSTGEVWVWRAGQQEPY